MTKTLVDFDPLLKPFMGQLDARRKYVTNKAQKLLSGQSITDFALGHLYYGLHRTADGWVFREWAPHANQIFLVGDFNNWRDKPEYELKRLPEGGVWQIELPRNALSHGLKYKLHGFWPGGDGFRIPSYANRVVQDSVTKNFNAEIWSPQKEYEWSDDKFQPSDEPPLVYEAHVGMSSPRGEVASYQYFTKNVLPRIVHAGYNTVQLMAIQEHPYYGSFGYHVSSFFASSSRFGTPNDLKELVDTAHKLGLRIIFDLVHSHAVKNSEEGLGLFDGDPAQYFYPGKRGYHPLWDSKIFDYGKNEVLHFLLSNCRFWLDEYHVDGFRFDGITSMLYSHHGLAKDFLEYGDYFHDDVDKDALTYLTLANRLIHQVKANSLTVAEEMSGYPGVATAEDNGGLGFDYRLSMGVPDLWIKTLKETKDEDWQLGHLFHELTTKRAEEKVISYAESHDQALVGDQTILSRLVGENIFNHMQIDDDNLIVSRGLALHKIIRLLTASLNGGGYLNFMGNEYGHPEWIDFPRQGNNWSFHYARRQWNLADDTNMKYHQLGAFDKDMLDIIKQLNGLPGKIYVHQTDHVLSFMRDGFLFVFNLSPTQSYTDYALPAVAGNYSVVLCSDDGQYGGHDQVDASVEHLTRPTKKGDEVLLYLPARTAQVLVRQI